MSTFFNKHRKDMRTPQAAFCAAKVLDRVVGSGKARGFDFAEFGAKPQGLKCFAFTPQT